MTEPLSPAAQAVLDAANGFSSYSPDVVLNESRWSVAAALRAAAHHLQRSSPWPNDVEGIGIDWCTSELHDIAAELEAHS